MPQMNMVQAINDALRLEMRRDGRVVLLGEDVGKVGGVFRVTQGLYDEFGEVGLDHKRAAERLHHHHHVNGATAEAAVILAKGQAEQPEFGIFLPHLLGETLGRLDVTAARIEGVAVGQKAADAVVQQPLVFGEFEIHQSLRIALFRMFFWISLVPP